jgi:hypothetical protein
MQQMMKEPTSEKPIVLGRTLVDPRTGKTIATDATWADEQKISREAKAQELQMKIADQQASRAERAEAQKQLMQMQIDGRRDIAGLAASMRQAPAPTVTEIVDPRDPKKTIKIDARTGAKIGDAPGHKAGPMSVALQKELMETDDLVNSSKNVIGSIDQALKINKDAYSGYGATTRATAMSNIPFVGGTKNADATIALDNIVTGGALENLKAIFGGNPTEGERKILLDIQASPNKTPTQREEIFGRARAGIERRQKYNMQKSAAIRNGTYLTDGVPDAAQAPDNKNTSVVDMAKAEQARRAAAKGN